MKRRDLTNQQFGKLIITKFSHWNSKHRSGYWFANCECGTIDKIVNGNGVWHGKIISCGCARTISASLRMIEYNKPRTLPPSIANRNALFSAYKNDAKSRNYKFLLNISEFEILTKNNCYYCGIEPKQIYNIKSTNEGYIYNGIDRKDNLKGYTIKNCVTCCKRCNMAKSNLSLMDFLDLIKSIYNKHIKHNE